MHMNINVCLFVVVVTFNVLVSCRASVNQLIIIFTLLCYTQRATFQR